MGARMREAEVRSHRDQLASSSDQIELRRPAHGDRDLAMASSLWMASSGLAAYVGGRVRAKDLPVIGSGRKSLGRVVRVIGSAEGSGEAIPADVRRGRPRGA